MLDYKSKLNLGCGFKKYDGFINIDCFEIAQPDYLINLDNKELRLPFYDNTIEEVKAHHILEHIGEGYFKLLQELYRVCKNGAIIDIIVPHHFHEVFINDPTHKRPITVEGLRLFSKKFNNLEIERQGSSSTLGLYYDVDFEIVEFDFHYDSFYDNILRQASEKELVRLMREANNVAIETYVKLVVVK